MIIGGYHPFDPYGENTDQEIIHNIINNNYTFIDEVDDIWNTRSNDCKNLIKACLTM